MLLTDLTGGQAALLLLPILPNLWSIWHAMRHDFPGEREKYLWTLAAVFCPCSGECFICCSGGGAAAPCAADAP